MIAKSTLSLLISFFALPFAAVGQSGPNPSKSPVVEEQTTIYNLQLSDLSDRNASWWQAMLEEHRVALHDDETASRERALRNLIFLANYQRDEVSLNRLTMPIFYVYLFDTEESTRILALAALHAIGKDASMRNLADHIKWERSDRVRQLTQWAVSDYFSKPN